jgi:acid stress chaperone HdeB
MIMIRALALASALLLLATPALAGKHGMDNIDFGQITCGQFIEDIAGGSEEDAGAVMLWIDGYLSGVSGDSVLNWKGLESYSERLVDYCGTHRKRLLLDAARKVGID